MPDLSSHWTPPADEGSGCGASRSGVTGTVPVTSSRRQTTGEQPRKKSQVFEGKPQMTRRPTLTPRARAVGRLPNPGLLAWYSPIGTGPLRSGVLGGDAEDEEGDVVLGAGGSL
jgi:hypothetical protein